jgi:hypothetical protein
MSAVQFGWEVDMDNIVVLVDKDSSILNPKARPLAPSPSAHSTPGFLSYAVLLF